MNFTVLTHKGGVTYPRVMKIKYGHSHKALNSPTQGRHSKIVSYCYRALKQNTADVPPPFQTLNLFLQRISEGITGYQKATLQG